jgi:dipeptidyl-peptidase-4
MKRKAQALCALTGFFLTLPLKSEVPSFSDLFDPALRPKVQAVQWSPDGELLAFRHDTPEGPRFRIWASSDGREIAARPWNDLPVLPEGKLAQPVQFFWVPASKSILWQGDGDLFLERVLGEPLQRFTNSPEAEEKHLTFSPDGRRLAFSRGGNLWTLDLLSGKETSWTSDGDGDGIQYGDTDWVYWEEIWNRSAQAIWWSPRGDSLAFYRFDDRHVGQFPLLNESAPYPQIRWQRYPKAGTRNPAVEVWVLNVETGSRVRLETGDPEAFYLARVHWHPKGHAVAVERLNRDQNQLDLLLCELPSGSCRVLARQEAATWINLGEEFRFLPDGSFLWASEEEGWRRLYHFSAEGERLRPITPPGWQVTELLGLTPASAPVAFVFQGFRTVGLGASERRVVAASFGAATFQVLDDRPGWHGGKLDPTGRFWLQEWSRATVPTERMIRRLDGAVIAALPAATPLPAALRALPEPEILEIPGPGGARLPAQMIRPPDLPSKGRYPILMYHYGGPGSQVVADRFDARRTLWHRWMAARGYVVLQVDNSASLFFGKRGEDQVHRRFGPLELEAQLAAVAWLKTQPWADTSRIGLWGWSGGGYHTLYALTHAPGVWRAAVAGAPVTDWSYYDSIWTERYLDHPEANAEGYRQASILEAADKLQDPLLLVHGTADDNVHPQNTVELLNRFIRAGKPVSVALYPGETHGFSPSAWRHLLERMTRFFDEHLQGGPCPKEPMAETQASF